jgi:hypothetical protein
MKQSYKTKIIHVALPLDLIALIETEAKDHDNFTKAVQAICRRYFLHKDLKNEFALLQ